MQPNLPERFIFLLFVVNADELIDELFQPSAPYHPIKQGERGGIAPENQVKELHVVYFNNPSTSAKKSGNSFFLMVSLTIAMNTRDGSAAISSALMSESAASRA